MLTALVLICSVAVGDIANCTRENAVSVMRTPVETVNPMLCFLHGQAYLAESSIAQDLAPGDRVRIICQHTDRGPR